MATIRQKGPNQWHVQVRRKGRPQKTATFERKWQAEEWAIETERSMRQGVYVDRSAAERTTLRQVLERYRDEVVENRVKKSSRGPDIARINRFLREEPDLAAHAMAYLTPEMWEAYRDRRLTETVSRGRPGGRGQYRSEGEPPAGRFRKDGAPRANAAKPKAPPKAASLVSPGSVKRELTLLKSAIDYSKKRLKLAANPLSSDEVKRPTVHDERDVRLSDEEWQKLLVECRASRNPWLAPAVELAVETGARRSSLLNLRWDDLKLNDASATLRGVKNSRNPIEVRTVEIGLSPRAIEILEALPRSGDGRVLPTTASALSGAFKRARVRADVEFFRLHDARHEMASTLSEAGWEMLDVMKQGDWRDPKSLARYYNARGQHLGAKLAELPARRRKE